MLFSRSVVSNSLWPHGLQHTSLPCPLPSPRRCSNSCPWSRWCHPTISSSVLPFSLKLKSIESVMPSNHLILCHPLLLPPSIPPSIRVFSNESTLPIRWPKYWSFSFNFSMSPSNEYSGLISFRIDWSDLLSVQGTLKSLLQYCNSKASIQLSIQFELPKLWVYLGQIYMISYQGDQLASYYNNPSKRWWWLRLGW